MKNGTLIIGHLDIPLGPDMPRQEFRLDPEYLYGEGIGASRGPLAALEHALRALRRIRKLQKIPLGVLYYSDEGRDCRYSAGIIQAAMAQAKRVVVLRPSTGGRYLITSRRGMRSYMLKAEGPALNLSEATRKQDVMRWFVGRLDELGSLSSKKDRLSILPIEVHSSRIAMRLPHEVSATVLMTYPETAVADSTEQRMREMLGKNRFRWRLERISDRPPMKSTKKTQKLAKDLEKMAELWGISIKSQSSAMPSVAGLAPASVATLCGLGPITKDLYTPHESVGRTSLMKRTLLLAQYLLSTSTK
jgi:D-alanine-D-alanine ligase